MDIKSKNKYIAINLFQKMIQTKTRNKDERIMKKIIEISCYLQVYCEYFRDFGLISLNYRLNYRVNGPIGWSVKEDKVGNGFSSAAKRSIFDWNDHSRKKGLGGMKTPFKVIYIDIAWEPMIYHIKLLSLNTKDIIKCDLPLKNYQSTRCSL